MFWGWGRILGSFLGGPLGALVRPPGACKAKAVTRVCINSLDPHNDENDACHESQHTTTFQKPPNHTEWLRCVHFGTTAFFKTGYDLVRCRPVRQENFQDLAIVHSDKIIAADFNTLDLTHLQSSDAERQSLLGLLLRFCKPQSVALCSDVQEDLATLPLVKSIKIGLTRSDLSTNEPTPKCKSQIEVATFSEVVPELHEKENSVRNFDEEMKLVEQDLMATQQKMEISLAGLQGLDLIMDGHFEEGFKLVTFAAKRKDPESLYNLVILFFGCAYPSIYSSLIPQQQYGVVPICIPLVGLKWGFG